MAALEAVLETVSDPRDKAAGVLACGAGLDVSELSHLKWDDVIDDAENPIKLLVAGVEFGPRQVLVERKLWNTYVAPLFFASLEGGAAGCTSTPAEPRIFPMSPHKLSQVVAQLTASLETEK